MPTGRRYWYRYLRVRRQTAASEEGREKKKNKKQLTVEQRWCGASVTFTNLRHRRILHSTQTSMIAV